MLVSPTARAAKAYILPTESGAAVMYDPDPAECRGDVALEVYAPFELSPGEIDYLRAEYAADVAAGSRRGRRSRWKRALLAIFELALLALLVYYFSQTGQGPLSVLSVAVGATLLPSAYLLTVSLRQRSPRSPGQVVAAAAGVDGSSVQRIGQIWAQPAVAQHGANHVDLENASRRALWPTAAVFYRRLRSGRAKAPMAFRDR